LLKYEVERNKNMATNNAINLPKNGFFAYLDTTASNVTGDGTMYTVLFDTLQAGA
jgi:hypothetical protein